MVSRVPGTGSVVRLCVHLHSLCGSVRDLGDTLSDSCVTSHAFASTQAFPSCALCARDRVLIWL